MMWKKSEYKNNPDFISVIVPVHNAEKHLLHTLPAIKESNYANFELIIIDDGSKDNSAEIAKDYANKLIINKSKEGPAKARNKAAEISKGSILLFVDADVQITPNTISIVTDFMKENPDIAAVFGSYDEKPFYKNFFSQYKNLFHHFIHQTANIEANTFWAGCGAIRKDIFMKYGGFSNNYSKPSIEDVELGYRLKENNEKIRILKELQVKHFKKWTFKSVLKADIVYRAIPWTKLASKKGLPKDLNFKISDRISGILACSLLPCLILTWFWTPLLILSITIPLILLCLNKNVYRFFLNKKGALFTLFAIIFHWFYFIYSSMTFGIFYILFSFSELFRVKS